MGKRLNWDGAQTLWITDAWHKPPVYAYKGLVQSAMSER